MSTTSQFLGSGVKSIQRGIAVMNTSDTSITVTITSVSTSKTELRLLGVRHVSGGVTDTALSAVNISLTNATTITCQRGATGAEVRVSWELTEFY